MSQAASIWADVARIRLEDASGQQLAFGSGRLIGKDLVLTARHVTETEATVALPDNGWEVRLLRDREGDTWRGDPIPATVIWRAEAPVDLALLHLRGTSCAPSSAFKLRLARYDQVSDFGGVWFAGFPDAAREQEEVALEYGAPAKLRRANDSFWYRVTVAAANAPKDNLDWRGCSGGSVALRQQDTLFLLGALAQVPRKFNGALNAVPIPEGLTNDNFRALLREACSFDLDDIQQLERLPGHYEVYGIAAYEASERVFTKTLEAQLYGRNVIELDARVSSGDRSAAILRAEAGMGKSAVLARWAAYRATLPESLPPTTVLRHAFSVGERASSTHDDMVASLVRQAAVSLGPDRLGGGEPRDPDHLSFLLGDQPAGTELIVALDGLDEAAGMIDPLPLGRGVHVVATCRAEPDETPRVIEKWRKYYTDTRKTFEELRLGPLDGVALAQWLTDATRNESARTEYRTTDPVVQRAMRASEGIPLFARYLIPAAIEALRRGDQDPFPKNFAAYARDQMTDLREAVSSGPGRGWQWDAILDLFAILVVAKAPLPVSWVQSLIKSQNLASESKLDALDERANRWLWRDHATGVRFAHPRLASVFRPILHEAFFADLRAAEKSLTQACAGAWKVSGNVLNSYALDWLPSHFISLNQDQKAAKLLGNGAFHLARLVSSPTEATVRTTAVETVDLDHRFPGVPDLTAWRCFWSETEGALLNGLANAERLKLEPIGIFSQLARDRFGTEAPVFRSLASALSKDSLSGMRLVRPCGFRHPALRRSRDHAHEREVGGVLALPDGLVSWGRDGAIRFWTLAGEPRPGGDPAAHQGEVRGVLALAEGLVSWGEDGAIRFWTLAGEPRPGGDPAAHRRGRGHWAGVRGVLALAEGLVSWGGDGAIRFWTFSGEPLPGGDPAAHRREHWAGVRGVLALAEGLVSWGGDGAIRFWTLAGAPRPGGDPAAHLGEVGGVLALADGLVSWGWDGAIRFWTLAGAPRPGGDPAAHRGWDPRGVRGVLALADGLVSWGWDGAIRFWTLAGAPRPGGDPAAHRGEVRGVLALADGLVSWGADGAIRFWTLAGELRPGGDPAAHRRGLWGGDVGVLAQSDGLVSWGGVGGVLAQSDGLVSWGGDGAIRFWTLAGAPRLGGDPAAHQGEVRGVLAQSDGLVSWGADGAIRFWTLASEPRPGGDPAAHQGWVGGILALADGLVSWGGDGAIRFWTLAGEPRPGGDPAAHQLCVRGVLVLADGLVSWGEDGAIRFWTLAGAPRPGGDRTAHRGKVRGGVGGVLALAGGLVSWGADGAIRFWTLAGEPRPGGDPAAHRGEVGGVVALADGLVSWGSVSFDSRPHESGDGAIRLWTLAGEPRPGRFPAVHGGGVRGVLALADGLVSWSAHGAIHYWTMAGEPRLGGAPVAHRGGVGGVLALADGLVSWGWDGAIRFWTLAGEPRPGGDPAAHRGEVRGVLALADGLVSWGADGAIRFWTLLGEPRPRGDPAAHRGGVAGVLALADGLVSCGWDDVIRQWSPDGMPHSPAWIAPARLNIVTKVADDLWVGLLGRPHRLLLS